MSIRIAYFGVRGLCRANRAQRTDWKVHLRRKIRGERRGIIVREIAAHYPPNEMELNGAKLGSGRTVYRVNVGFQNWGVEGVKNVRSRLKRNLLSTRRHLLEHQL